VRCTRAVSERRFLAASAAQAQFLRTAAAVGLLLLVLTHAASAAVPSRVTVITDSVGGILHYPGGGGAALGRGIDLDVEAKVCRRLVTTGCQPDVGPPPLSALDTINALGPQIGSTVVIDVGYNDDAASYGAALDETMAALGAAGVRHVVWVTLRETQSGWIQIDDAIRAAPARWPQVVVADWAAFSAGQPWFVDLAHLNVSGGLALASFLRPFVLRACGAGCAFSCGLARTVRGFEPVQAAGIDCPEAREAIAAAERGTARGWACTRRARRGVQIDCVEGVAHARALVRPAEPTLRHRGFVSVAQWSFRVRSDHLEAREGLHGWVDVARAPFCVPLVPSEVLVALGLHRVRRDTSCFA
jgi:hypothetical protein